MWASVSKWTAAFAGITGGIAGGMLITESILTKAAQNEWEHTPSFGNFATDDFKVYIWWAEDF